jgi:acyl-CoA reductase-like NAD-dependent aldehyde dehydrogenase
MNIRELRRLLEDIEDTHELVLRGCRSAGLAGEPDELRAAWAAARAEAHLAYDAWLARGGAERYAVYRAAADRADAAQEALAVAAGLHPGRGLTSQARHQGSPLVPRAAEL